MADGFVHTVYKNDQCLNEIEGGSEYGGAHAIKEAAVSAGRSQAQQDKTEHVIHEQDGTISERTLTGTTQRLARVRPFETGRFVPPEHWAETVDSPLRAFSDSLTCPEPLGG